MIPYGRQFLDEEDIKAVAEVLRSDWLTTGPQVEAFEEEIAKYTGAMYAVVCNSGTAALHLAVSALNLNDDNYILTTPITFLADANAGCFVGIKVAFADVEPNTINLDPEKVREALISNPSIKAVIPVHFGGLPADMNSFWKLSNEFGVTIIEDACHALGATYNKNSDHVMKVGNCHYSTMTIFSFHAVKHITTGEGGCITTNDIELYKKMKILRSHGIVRDFKDMKNKHLAITETDKGPIINPWYYEMQILGYNYRLTDFQCALGRSQLKKIDYFVARRRKLAEIYRTLLGKRLSGVVTPLSEKESSLNIYHLFVVMIDFGKLRGGRAALMSYLYENNIGTQVHYIPLHFQPFYQKFFSSPVKLEVAENYYSKCLSLPMFPGMSDDDPKRVVDELQKAIEELQIR